MARQRLTTRSRQNDGDDAMRCEVVFKSSFDDDDDDDDRDDRDEVENLMKTGADVQQMQRRVRTLKRSLNESTSREEALRRNYAALSGAHAKLKEEFENTMRDLQSTKKERERLVDNERRKAKEVAVLTKEVGHRERSDAEAAELRVKCKQMVRTNASCMNATHDSPVIIGDEGRRGGIESTHLLNSSQPLKTKVFRRRPAMHTEREYTVYSIHTLAGHLTERDSLL